MLYTFFILLFAEEMLTNKKESSLFKTFRLVRTPTDKGKEILSSFKMTWIKKLSKWACRTWGYRNKTPPSTSSGWHSDRFTLNILKKISVAVCRSRVKLKDRNVIFFSIIDIKNKIFYGLSSGSLCCIIINRKYLFI